MRSAGRVVSGGVMIALGIVSVLLAGVSPDSNALPEATEVERFAFRPVGDGIGPVHQRMLDNLRARGIPEMPSAAACFAPGTPNEVMDAFHEALGFNDRFQQDPANYRWAQTATDGPTSPFGEGITLTYSFVPDGTFIPSGVGEPAAVSDLFFWLNSIYFSPGVWQQLFHDMFARWGEISGVNYVFEPNDDGADVALANTGILGVRGDVRICAKLIDGNGGTLAYNNFPQQAVAATGNGDMVIDSADSFYDLTFGDSVRMRNVLAHEHGHGLGMFHVCPVNQDKLMEPSVSVPFFGQQHDEIRGAHAMYGDAFEPDNSAGAATSLGALALPFADTLGTLGPPVVANGSALSIDADGEQDWFSFSITTPGRVSAQLNPVGLLYEDGPQSCGGQPANCCPGFFTDSQIIADLGFEVIAGDGVTVIASGNSNGAGIVEAVADVALNSAGTYYLRVFENGVPVEPQLYTLDVAVESELSVSLPNGAPEIIAPGAAAPFDVIVDPRSDTLVANSAVLRYRYDGGAYLSAPLVLVDPMTNLYTATLPGALCDDIPEFYVEAEGVLSGVVTEPAGGASAPSVALVGSELVIADLDFESDPGWFVTNVGVTDGAWEIGVPVNCDRADPPADFDGSGNCFLTTNDAIDCNSDVDDGTTILETTDFDLTGLTDARVSYARWFTNVFVGAPGSQEDPFLVQYSTNGGVNWSDLEVVGPSLNDAIPDVVGGWVQRSFDLDPLISGATQVRFRWIAEDIGQGSVVEAGLDAFRLSAIECDFTPAPCLGDADGSGVVDFGDITSVLSNFLNDYTPGTGLGDANGDGLVDFADITSVLSNFLQVCP